MNFATPVRTVPARLTSSLEEMFAFLQEHGATRRVLNDRKLFWQDEDGMLHRQEYCRFDQGSNGNCTLQPYRCTLGGTSKPLCPRCVKSVAFSELQVLDEIMHTWELLSKSQPTAANIRWCFEALTRVRREADPRFGHTLAYSRWLTSQYDTLLDKARLAAENVELDDWTKINLSSERGWVYWKVFGDQLPLGLVPSLAKARRVRDGWLFECPAPPFPEFSPVEVPDGINMDKVTETFASLLGEDRNWRQHLQAAVALEI